jgi:hypothetical protein
MMRKLTSAFMVLVASVLAWPALSLAAAAQGGDTFVLSDEQGKYPLGPHLEILEDPDGQLTIEQVASPEYNAQFVSSCEKTPNPGYTDSAYWVRFRAKNKSAENHEWRQEPGVPGSLVIPKE